jgi:hypothetical protein
VNLYAEATGRLGDHVDNSESPAALASGYPVVSLSAGASCAFRIGGPARTDPYEQHTLDSGDLVIFGREAAGVPRREEDPARHHAGGPRSARAGSAELDVPYPVGRALPAEVGRRADATDA